MPSKTQIPSSIQSTHASLNAALDVVGTRCAMHVLLAAGRGTRRFESFVEQINITEAVIAKRLRALVDDGVLERQPYREPGQRTRSEYVLTSAGEKLIPIAEALASWGAESPDNPSPPTTGEKAAAADAEYSVR